MNLFLIIIYIWSVIVILDIANKKAYKHYSKTVRCGMPAGKFQLIYCHKIYFRLNIILRLLHQLCAFLCLIAILVILAKYIW